jgi:predicted transcriptional regulator
LTKVEPYLERIRMILSWLSRHQLNRTELETKFFAKAKEKYSFDRTLRFLAKEGYIEKIENKKRSPYRITEKGKRLLEALS